MQTTPVKYTSCLNMTNMQTPSKSIPESDKKIPQMFTQTSAKKTLIAQVKTTYKTTHAIKIYTKMVRSLLLEP